jgi:ADP-heptose:LPS heptosyltransferase
VKKILFINPFGIGDVLFTTPLISALKDVFPDSIICYWCNKRVKDVFLNNPKVSQVVALSRGDLKKINDESPAEGLRQFQNLYLQ